MMKIATKAWEAGCAQILPKVGRAMRSSGARAQWMAHRTDAATPRRSAFFSVSGKLADFAVVVGFMRKEIDETIQESFFGLTSCSGVCRKQVNHCRASSGLIQEVALGTL